MLFSVNPIVSLPPKISNSKIDKSRAEVLVKDLLEAIDRENYDRMKSLSNELQQALMQIGSAVYSQAGSTSTNGSTSTDGGAEDIIDADFVDQK